MALSIKNVKAEKLVREISQESGESITQTIIQALEEKAERIHGRKSIPDLYNTLLKISERCSKYPDKDKRSPDTILGYNKKNGGLS